MASLAPHMEQRRTPRGGVKVIHQHRIGSTVVKRVSELVFIKGRPLALIEWIDLGGVRTPLFTCELDVAQLRTGHRAGLYEYDGLTIDPRFKDAAEEGPTI